MEELIKYYCNLLIIQYRNKPKARATIEALVRSLFEGENGEVLLLEIQNAYNLDNAQEAQLDVLAKYIGYDKNLNIINDNYFKLSDTEGSDITPGLSDTEDNYSGYPLLTYSGYTFSQVSVTGLAGIEFFRKTLQFLAESKNKILSLGELDELLYKYFGEDIWAEEGVRNIVYNYSEGIYQLFGYNSTIVEAFIKKFFPRPMGYGISANEKSVKYLQFTINTANSLTYTINYSNQYGAFDKIEIDWGDGTEETFTSYDTFPSHTYSEVKDYVIKITSYSGDIPSIIFGNMYRPDNNSMALKSIDYINCRFVHSLNEEVIDFSNFCCNCTNLTSVPENLFAKNKNAISFYRAFYSSGLKNIPENLFSENIKAYNFKETFAYTSDLEEIPNGLFKNVSLNDNPDFEKTFYDNGATNKCKINSNIFCVENDEKGIRFKDVVPNFFLTFARGGNYLGIIGTAPELWNYTYKEAPNGMDCFLGQSSSSLTNYSNIPNTWGGN